MGGTCCFFFLKYVFGLALLHLRAVLLQNSRLEQLYFEILTVFDKIYVHSFKK
jgi:hypothetical protein